MATVCPDHLTFWALGSQQILLDFQGGCLVTDTGLLAVRALERPLRVIAGLAQLLPDPRAPKFLTHSAEALLTQEVYQLLAGYPDHADPDADYGVPNDDRLHDLAAKEAESFLARYPDHAKAPLARYRLASSL